ncbi:MAG TPA: hypothetical protein VGD80_24560, partial [Kofleriaceae bacterium]
MTVAERLAHHDDVGDHALRFERPPVRADPAEPGLDLVGDAHAAGSAHRLVDPGEIAVGEHALAADARTRLGDEAGERAAACADRRDGARRVGGIARPGVARAALVRS